MVSAVHVPPLLGLRGVKLPVRDIRATREWYSRVFGWVAAFEFPDATGAVVGVGGPLPGHEHSTGLAFRLNPEAHAQEGLELSMVVDTRADLQRWVEHLDREGVPHSGVIDATISWLVALKDPDGHEIHLFTREEHGINQAGRAGYGRRVPGVHISSDG